MTDKADHIAWAAEAVAVFQEHCRTGDEHAIADLRCVAESGFEILFCAPGPIAWHKSLDLHDGA